MNLSKIRKGQNLLQKGQFKFFVLFKKPVKLKNSLC